MKRFDELDIIIPISLDIDWPTKDGIIAEIRERHENYGFNRFALMCPGGGWRGVGYPSREFWKERAEWFAQIRETLRGDGIDCGWWITATLKSGRDPMFSAVVRTDGTDHPFANCPLDEAFAERFTSDIAIFAKIAKPSFIITEDDFSVHAAGGIFGCFCEKHLSEFAKREGKEYTREELIAIFESNTQEGFEMLRRWRELARDSIVGFASKMRQALDQESCEIPMGYMQSGCCDLDGGCTYAVSKALAGENHTPFSRAYGAFYNGFSAQDIPSKLFHAFYTKQHITDDFVFYIESDTFPHTRFFTSGKEITAIMGASYSMGFDGSTFQTQQQLDCAGEENAYAKAFARERVRFNALNKAVKRCKPIGAQLCFDSFWNMTKQRIEPPYWTKTLGMFGIPWQTADSDIIFLDKVQAQFDDDCKIRKYLSKPLVFVDGTAAKILNERGYGEYLGVKLGEAITSKEENQTLSWDLGAREVIREEFVKDGNGKNMPSAHMYARSNGRMLEMEVTNPSCEIIADAYSYDQRYLTPSITRFKNSLGGTVIVMGITLESNISQSLFNYRRQRLIHSLIVGHCDVLAFVKEEPRIFTLMNDADTDADFKHLLTLLNLSSDDVENAAIHLPPEWRKAKEILILDRNGEWKNADFSVTDDGIVLNEALRYLENVFIMFK